MGNNNDRGTETLKAVTATRTAVSMTVAEKKTSHNTVTDNIQCTRTAVNIVTNNSPSLQKALLNAGFVESDMLRTLTGHY